MKSLIFKCVAVVIIVIGASQYFMYITTGKAPFEGFSLGDATASLPELPSLNDQPQRVYKWVDENGITQYASEPPPGTENAVAMDVDPNLNLIQGIELPGEEESDTPAPAAAPTLPVGGSIYHPENVKKLMDDAQQVQELLNERYKKTEEAL